MMPIYGASVKPNAIIDYLLELGVNNTTNSNQNNLSNHSNNDSSISFPIELPNIELDFLKENIATLGQIKDQKLLIQWNHNKIEDSIFSSMKVYSELNNNVILENECVIIENDFKAPIAQMNHKQLFAIIAYVVQMSFIDVLNPRFIPSRNNRNLCLHLDLYFGNIKAKRNTEDLSLIQNLSKRIKIKKRTQNTIIDLTADEQISNTSSAPSTSSSSSAPSDNTSSSIKRKVSSEEPVLYAPSTSSEPPVKIQKKINSPFSSLPRNYSIEEFYKFIQPPVSKDYLVEYTSDKLIARLTPFQTQNVEWMISREGHMANLYGSILPNTEIFNELPLLYTGTHQDQNRGSYLNLFTNIASSDRSYINQLVNKSYRGGILADEMGLGKTLSVLGLVTKHVLSPLDPYHPQQSDFPDITISKATLIISPASIIHQWKSEIEKHAPSLKVFIYEGRRVHPDIESDTFEDFDIVLTHYQAFNSEIYYTKPRAQRPKRSGVSYKMSYKVSPLISTLWFRCILDEAQMVEATLTQVASVAKLIPRWYSWAVTGTPMKNKFTDMYGLYAFLMLEESLHNSTKFDWFCNNPEHKDVFYKFMKTTIRRNMKSLLEDQIYIPKQNRHVVRIPFTTIERHYYDDLWRRCKRELRLDWMESINWTLPEDASPSIKNEYNEIKAKMRSWLLALRQNCIHPSLIGNNSLRLNNQSGSNRSSKIATLDEVLVDMARDAKVALTNHQQSYYRLKLRIGGMHEVLCDWESARSQYEKNVGLVEELTAAQVDLIKLQKSKDTVTNSLAKEREDNFESRLTQSLNRWHILLHQYYFYMAGVYHQMALGDLENLYYSKASEIRRMMLENHTTKVKTHTIEMKKTSSKVDFNDELKMGERQFDSSFIESTEYEDESQMPINLNAIENVKHLGSILDRQYEKILYLRGKIIPILTKELVDNDTEEVTGDEYDSSLIEQELCQIYLSAYDALLKDRKFMIKGAIFQLSDTLVVDNGEYTSEEAQRVETIEKAFRQGLNSPVSFRIECIKDVEFTLKGIRDSYLNDAENRDIFRLLDSEYQHLRAKIKPQSKLIDLLDTDFRKLSELYNSRVAYYKHLQTISDTLLAWKEHNPSQALERLEKSIEKLDEQINQGKSRDQYFKNLLEEQKSLNEGGEQTAKECLICQETIEKGIITYCGHTSCMNCGITWFKSSRRCHTCNSAVQPNEWYNISYKKVEMYNKENDQLSSNAGDDENQQKLKKLIDEIHKQPIVEGKGAKLDSIIRHIKHIKNTNNGKCIVFSQWTKTLDMLKNGLMMNDIGCTSINAGISLNKNNVNEFQKNPNINVILLHSRSQSSGLTLTAAQTVFIVEPVLNEALEKQAINRIHRIGQTKETSVFWYVVQDTIEERIQAIHDVKRSHKSTQVTDENTEYKLTEGGSEYVSNDDLYRCFSSETSFALR